ncbi:hypothetical protein BN961_00391 [Afipia felis]|jgi:hypothetical protein|uniref:Uncharacterized protein n=1 Tax=Afipia felis TaxID=1035 RepID=A0A090MHA2_AFIFE|nr:hypothetical protein [Afipia felis]CEG07010.1 hypothetical protein BN961_00391 [Afipia felis]
MHPKLFKTDDPFANPEAAAKELIRLCKAEMEQANRSFAYTGTVNFTFIYDGGGTPASYGAGRDYAINKGWLTIDESGSRIMITPEGEDA